jgi:hypothetical protein
MTNGLRFNYEDFLYIRTRGPEDKRPRDKWGGYDLEIADREDVYTHEEVAECDWDYWAVVDAVDGEHATVSTLIFDLDVHKAPDDFDPDRVTVPDNTALVRSQNGGWHVHFKVINCDPGELAESDFEMTTNPGWDVDIRGSAVSHHVVAPADIPGVDTPYSVENDYRVKTVTDPADAASRIRLDGEPLLEFSPDTSYTGSVEIDRDVEPPEEMPACYHRGLQLREENPDDHPNTHKVNVLTALCGLAAGYDVETVVDHFVDEYAPGPNADLDKTEYQVNHLAKKLDSGTYSPPALSTLRDYGILEEEEACDCDIPYHGSAPAEMSGGDVDTGGFEDREVSPDRPAGNLMYSEQVGGYYYLEEKTNRQGETYLNEIQVTNFRLDTLEFLETDEGELLRIRVTPLASDEEPYEVSVSPTVFNEPRQFKEEVVRGRTTRYEPRKRGQEALNDLRETVGLQDAPERVAIDHLGAESAHLREFVNPNGVLGPDGWLDDPNYKYYAKASADDDDSIVGEKWALDPEEDDDVDESAVCEALRRLPKARLPARALAMLGWFYSAPVKPLVHDEEGEFNHLHVRGKTESGKTSYLETLTAAFGMKPEPWSASATPFTLEQLHVGSRGVPVWIDEYKPSDMHNRTVDRLDQYLRISTREGTWTKGSPDQTHISFRMQSPIVLSGEQSVSDPAVRRRMLQVNLSERATENPEQVRAYSELAGEPYEGQDGRTKTPAGISLRDHAYAYYQFLAGCDADVLREVWQDSRDRAAELMDSVDVTLEGSEFQGAQTIVFGHRLMQRFAETVGLDKASLPGETVLEDAILHVAENVGANGQRREHGDELLELVAQAANSGYLTSREAASQGSSKADYRVYDPGLTEKEALAIHMPSVYPEVKRYARDYNLEDDYNLLQKSDYDDEFADLAQSDGNHVASNSHNVRVSPGGNPVKCLVLDARETARRLGRDFDLSAFGLTDVDLDESETAGSDDDDDDGSTLIENIEDAYFGPGSAEIRVTVEDTIDPKPWLQSEGTVVDESGKMDFVARGDANPLPDGAVGEEYIIRDFRLTEGEYGATKLEFRPDVEFEPVSKTAGSTQSSVADVATDGAGDTTDAEDAPASARGKVTETIADHRKQALAKGVLVQEATDRFEDLSVDEAQEAVRNAVESGELVPRSDDKLELRSG